MSHNLAAVIDLHRQPSKRRLCNLINVSKAIREAYGLLPRDIWYDYDDVETASAASKLYRLLLASVTASIYIYSNVRKQVQSLSSYFSLHRTCILQPVTLCLSYWSLFLLTKTLHYAILSALCCVRHIVHYIESNDFLILEVLRVILIITRCSAIAERPRCRMRYSLRQK